MQTKDVEGIKKIAESISEEDQAVVVMVIDKAGQCKIQPIGNLMQITYMNMALQDLIFKSMNPK